MSGPAQSLKFYVLIHRLTTQLNISPGILSCYDVNEEDSDLLGGLEALMAKLRQVP